MRKIVSGEKNAIPTQSGLFFVLTVTVNRHILYIHKISKCMTTSQLTKKIQRCEEELTILRHHLLALPAIRDRRASVVETTRGTLSKAQAQRITTALKRQRQRSDRF